VWKEASLRRALVAGAEASDEDVHHMRRPTFLSPGVAAFVVVVSGVGYTVHWVHKSQQEERKAMREAVLRDIEKLGR
jgi:hypothetical protein